MRVEARRAEFDEIAPLKALYREEAQCQIVRDSILERGLADAYLILVDGRAAGYGGVWNAHFPGRLMEFHTLPERRADAVSMFREVLAASGATRAEAQTNMPLMIAMLYDCATNIRNENILFEDGSDTNLRCPGAVFRSRAAGDQGPEGEWVVETNAAVVAAGGVLYHYNPPFGDLYVTVVPAMRRRGVGSYLVQELRRVCSDAGGRPAARCDPENLASRRALERGGLVVCGQLLAGDVDR